MIDRVGFAASSHNFPQRIHIVGGPGTGKSTLARRLGESLSLPVHHLDDIAFEGIEFLPRPLTAKMADVERIASEPRWICEGIFVGWVEALTKRADLIIWLDHVTWPRAAYRISRRFLAGGISEAKRHPGVEKFTRFHDYARHTRQLVFVLLSTCKYYTSTVDGYRDGQPESRMATKRFLAPYLDKVAHCRSQSEIDDLIADFARLKRHPVSLPLRS